MPITMPPERELRDVCRDLDRLPAITIQPPYADLIARGFKTVENRARDFPWRSAIGKDIAIHSGKSRSWLATDEYHQIPHDELRFGGIVAVARLLDVRSLWEVWHIQDLAAFRTEHAIGLWCLLLEEVRPVRFVPCGGFQGLWYVNDQLWRRNE